MPKFLVNLSHTRTAYLAIEISAKDDDAAQEKAEKVLEDLEYDPDKIAKKFKEEWDMEEDTMEIDSVEEQ
jgi:hypothetical protein